MNLVNTNPFPISLKTGHGKITLPKTTLDVRVVTNQVPVSETSEGVSIAKASNPRIVGLPQKKDGTGYVTNLAVYYASKIEGRDDCYAFNAEAEGTVRNEKGQIEIYGGLLS